MFSTSNLPSYLSYFEMKLSILVFSLAIISFSYLSSYN